MTFKYFFTVLVILCCSCNRVNGTLKCYIWDDLPNTGLKGNTSEVAKVLGSEPGLTSSKPNHPSASCYGENYCGAVYATGSANGQSVKAEVHGCGSRLLNTAYYYSCDNQGPGCQDRDTTINGVLVKATLCCCKDNLCNNSSPMKVSLALISFFLFLFKFI